MNDPINEKDLAILQVIEDEVLTGLNLGFDPQVLQILDDADAEEKEIELLKTRISEEVLMRLFNIANSVYYGHLRKGKVDNFYQVVSRLGMSYTKTLIVILAPFALLRSADAEIVYARCFATAMVGGNILAREFGLREDDAKKVELGGLFSEIGKIIVMLHQEHHADSWKELNPPDDFMEKYHPWFAEKMVERFNLPEYLKDMICCRHIKLGIDLLTLPGITHLAWSSVDASFRSAGKFVIDSPMPDPEGQVITTQGAIISDQFRAIGLEKYLKIIKRDLPQTSRKHFR